MKALPSGKTVGTFALIVFSVFVGFISSLYFINSKESNNEIEPVFAETEIDSNLSGALALQNTYRKVAADVLPVVVEIEAVEFREGGNPQFTNPFNFFFGPGNGEDEEEGEEGEDEEETPQFRNEGLGSGIIVRKDGNTYYVLTNDHVAGNADEITIRLFDDRTFVGVLVGKDERKDLALLSFETRENLSVGILGDSDDLYVGDFVLAVGNPFGYQSTVTSGIISALGRQQGPSENISDFIQTDASINQGNSGGALVNLEGEIIGVNTWITTPTGGSIGLGFSIPINNAKKAIDDIINTGSPEYGWLGVSIGNISTIVAENMELDSTQGVFVSQVFKNSPADKGGIHAGDIILSIDGERTETSDELLYLVGDKRPGTRVVFELLRYNQRREITVRIEKRETEEEVDKMSSSNMAWPGVTIFPLNEDMKERLSIDADENGVVIFEVYPKTPLQIAGLKSGDLITAINDTPIETITDFYRLLNENTRIKFTYVREGVTMETSSIVNR